MSIRKLALLGCISILALLATPAMAQDAAAETDNAEAIQDIVVTAQRRSERVQDIPVAISAFGGEAIERAGIASLENIAPRVPSFYFGSFGAARPQLYIRGIGSIQVRKALWGCLPTMSISVVPAAPLAQSRILTGSKFCAVRRAHFMVAIQLAARST